jgi:hypothetical protein
MKKLSKELQKKISEGYHDALMEGIEELINMYNNKPWTDGYEACKDDVSVHSLRLAEHIVKEFKESRLHIDIQGKTIILNASKLGEIIEEYFENALKA